MSANHPKKLHEYTNHPVIDSTRWRVYNHRPGDIVISTSYKTGTTWMQTIVANLLFQDGQFPAPVSAMAPWLDMAVPPLEEIARALEAQTHRRFIKAHLALDGLPFFETARYIVVGRDIRDVFMSVWNHHSGYTDELKAAFRERAESFGREFPLDIEDIHELWRMWIDKGWYEWESSGYPSSLVTPPPHANMVGFPSPAQHPTGPLRRFARGPRAASPAHREPSRHPD